MRKKLCCGVDKYECDSNKSFLHNNSTPSYEWQGTKSNDETRGHARDICISAARTFRYKQWARSPPCGNTDHDLHISLLVGNHVEVVLSWNGTVSMLCSLRCALRKQAPSETFMQGIVHAFGESFYCAKDCFGEWLPSLDSPTLQRYSSKHP